MTRNLMTFRFGSGIMDYSGVNDALTDLLL